jgi:Dolichyl-phosphate-mannose-protein mannosyltransferase
MLVFVAMLTRAPVAALVIVVAFLAVNSLRLVQLGGPRTGYDTSRFVNGAANLIAGLPYQDKQASYRGYIWIVAASQKVFGSASGVLVVQWLCGLIATLLLYQVMADRAGARLALAGSLAFVVFPDISQWNNYVLSDSLYISAVAANLFAIDRVLQGATAGRVILAGATLAFAALLRPSGWIIAAVTVPFLAVEQLGFNRRSLALAVILMAGGVSLYLGTELFRRGVSSEFPDRRLAAGIVIDNYWAANHRMPPPTFALDGTLTSYVRYAAEAPLATAGVLAERVGFAVSHVRPFYSRAHNLVNAVMLWPLNALALVAIRRPRDAFTWYLCAVCAAHLALVAFILADSDGRFYMHTFPAVVVLAVDGLAGWRR